MRSPNSNKRERTDSSLSLPPRKTHKLIPKVGFFYLKSVDACPISSSTNSSCKLFCLRSDRLYTVGRSKPCCDIVFQDRRISKRHCQIFFDSVDRKIYVLDGFLRYVNFDLNEIRRQFKALQNVGASLNGVFVNGVRIGQGAVKDLNTGDEILLVCGNELDCSFGARFGFVVERVVFTEEVLRVSEMMVLNKCSINLIGGRSTEDGRCAEVNKEAQKQVNKVNVIDLVANVMYRDFRCNSGYEVLISRAEFLLNKCRQIVQSEDPISYILECKDFSGVEKGDQVIGRENDASDDTLSDGVVIPSSTDVSSKTCFDQTPVQLSSLKGKQIERSPQTMKVISVEATSTGPSVVSEVKPDPVRVCVPCDTLLSKLILDDASEPKSKISLMNGYGDHVCQDPPLNHTGTHQGIADPRQREDPNGVPSSSGKKFYLNCLGPIDYHSLDQHMVVTLPELLHPVESITRMFIATFTSDILWFLSYCGVSNNLPVTIACHNTQRCWSSSPDERISIPYVDFPKLVVVYPPFPEVIAFGKDRNRQGIACHHPKLLVLQRENSVRVIVTSANLVSKQWNNVSNTVWWQDFPRRSVPDYSSIFSHLIDGDAVAGLKCDFAAELAGFMASLLVDVPCQAHWITELTKYNFTGAYGHLVSSVPGMHIRSAALWESLYYLSANHCSSRSIGMKFIGSVEASLVGLKHRFHSAADSNGAQLKTLAAFFGKCRENAFGMSEVGLKRITNIPADANAVSVFFSDLDEFSEGDYIQLGFLPRNIAKWVAPLCDAGFFSFSAYIYPKEVLAAALEGSNSIVQLIILVSEGPNFSEISKLMQVEHVAALSSLVGSMQRTVGIWRLHELLGRYKWPERLETDFVYGSSSIGTSLNAPFLAAFSAAAGKSSLQCIDSEESDPEWGRWSSSQELKNPSLRIIFPTIERVKDASCGIWPSRRLLCLSEKTWQRLRSVDIFHDAIPQPSCRLGYPMHVKVARRRFQSRTDGPSFGWVYCGSHNFSPAAWGRPMPSSSKKGAAAETTSCMGSRLHICNYELGIVFIVPPFEASEVTSQTRASLDDIVLPFVVPAPKYRKTDRPATKLAMREALQELAELQKEISSESEVMGEMMDEEILDEQEVVEVAEYIPEEKEEEKIYAEELWSQVDSSER